MKADDLTPLEQEVLRGIQPTAEETAHMEKDAADLVRAAASRLSALRVPGTPTVQGSVAKGTWLRGSGDIDLFLLLDPTVPEGRLEAITEDVAQGVLAGLQKRYAQHPYLMGTFRGRTVDLVPAYKVDSASARMSAVDRTPFHTAWVREHLDEAGRGQARLLKRWLKGTQTYGAQTAIGGFSGYLAEVLLVRLGSFHAVVEWLAAGAQPRRLALGPDQVNDPVSPLIVVDPVDPARNCAAAIQEETLDLAIRAARAYKARPDRRFFFPAPPRAEPPTAMDGALAARSQAWLGLLLRPRTPRLDIVFPQFQKGARAIAAALAQAGFPTLALQCLAADDGREVLVQWLADARELPPSRLHRGPAAGAGSHAERFRAKWDGHPDALGPVRASAGGQLEVEVRVPQRTAAEWLRAHLAGVALGRHVTEALPDARLLDRPGDAPEAWRAQVSEFVLRREPWER